MSLRNMVLYVRDITRAVKFYSHGLQLAVTHSSPTTAHLAFANTPVPLVLHAVDGSVVFSPT